MASLSPPFLFLDTSGGRPNWNVALSTPHLAGVILKASEGTSYAPSWFAQNWQAMGVAAGTRLGSSWLRGAYHFLRFPGDGAAQADFYLTAVERAGGFVRGDIWPIVDVERGGGNASASAQQTIDTTAAFADRVKRRRGGKVILYGRGAMRDLGIATKMGCDYVWNPGYTATMPMNGLSAWSPSDIVLWQYSGTDGKGNVSGSTQHGLPLTIPNFGTGVDMSVYLEGGEVGTSLAAMRRRLTGATSGWLTALTLAAGVGAGVITARWAKRRYLHPVP